MARFHRSGNRRDVRGYTTDNRSLGNSVTLDSLPDRASRELGPILHELLSVSDRLPEARHALLQFAG